MGVEPYDLVRVSRLLGTCQPIESQVLPGFEPVFLLTKEVCCQNTYIPFSNSDPGWNRTSTFLVVTQVSLSLDHGIVFLSVTEVGLEPTGTRLSTSPLCQFAYPVKVAGPGVAPGLQAYETPLSLAHPQVAGPGIEPGAPAV